MRYQLKLDRPEVTPILPDDKEGITRLRKILAQHDLIAIDTETTGLDIAKDIVVMWSIAVDLDARYFLWAESLDDFKDLLEDPDKSWIGSQIKYDANVLANSGVKLQGDLLCTLTMDRLHKPSQRHGLKESYERQFHERMRSFGEVFYPRDKKGIPRKPPKKEMYEILMERWETDPELVMDYASMDAWSVLRLFYRLSDLLSESITCFGDSLLDIFYAIEVPLTRVLFEMERAGILLDRDYLLDERPQLTKRMEEIERTMAKKSGRIINLNSTVQLSTLLYDELGYQPLEATATGRPKLDTKAYEYLEKQGCEEAALVSEYKKLGKLISTYIDGLLERCDKKGYLHTTFNQHIADTARLSSSNPNLQNQMKEGKGVVSIRKAFIAKPDWTLLVGDYDQLEMYILGDFSDDPNILEAIATAKDIHCANVELIYEEPYEEVLEAKNTPNEKRTERQKELKTLRDHTKALGFGICYGKAARSLAIDMKLPQLAAQIHPRWSDVELLQYATNMAQEKIDHYFEKNVGVRKFIQSTIRNAYKTGYVETMLGRRRDLPNMMEWDEMMEHKYAAQIKGRNLCWCRACEKTRQEERRAVNARIQGSAADITSSAMIALQVDDDIREAGFHQLLQIHDEIVGTCPEKNKVFCRERMQWNMEHPGVCAKVPFRANPHWGPNWAEAKS